jgi:tetratricopeptide (TPR) repeat protein
MKRFSGKICFIALALWFAGLAAQAQSLDQAKRLYDEGMYAEAKPAFERLVKQAPNNGSYNHWYGVCCFETGDMENAEKYLEVGVKRKVQESYHYLAELYFRTYQFEKSSGMYGEYINILAGKKQDTEAFEERQAVADNARRMLEKVEDVEVIDSMTVNKDDFLKAYTLSEECGSLTPYETFFQTGEPFASVVYMNQKGNKIYYAGKADENRLSLFTQSKLIDKWGDEKQLPMNVNTSGQDDNYPFVLSDGITLYYASKGNGSIGGYDIFVTRYHTGSDSYLAPEQLGMPYNSIYNDYMIVFDEVKKLGWFVSDRYQPEDKVCVYLFITNEDRSRVESEDMEVKRAYAMLASIETTWKESSGYALLIGLAHKELPFGEVKKQKDFEFIINGTLVYYTLDEIRSPEARNYYEKAIAVNKEAEELKKKLAGLRTEYTAGDNNRRDRLRPLILQAEKQLEALLPQPDEWEKRARNAEITYLKGIK